MPECNGFRPPTGFGVGRGFSTEDDEDEGGGGGRDGNGDGSDFYGGGRAMVGYDRLREDLDHRRRRRKYEMTSDMEEGKEAKAKKIFDAVAAV